jgi:1-aminocyclopropane-1-carboxylate deaminase/D-cysteine desulfhydrase-like pyridoxal-dependent ACC family enzyme
MAEFMIIPEQVSIDPLPLPAFAGRRLDVQVLRLDKIHPAISGNKWFKLKYYLEAARVQQKKRLISFGGAYSNHLAALAYAAQACGFTSTAFIRGEKAPELSHTLTTAWQYGMELRFLPRRDYRGKTDPGFLSALALQYPDALIIPEGGADALGVRGAEEITLLPDVKSYAHICCAAGTGATLAGLLNGSDPQQRLTGISVLKGTKGLEPVDLSLIKHPALTARLSMLHDYHFGGYARWNSELLDLMNQVYDRSGIPTDFVYTAKLFYALVDLARSNYFPPGSRILILHSGGLQGNRSLPAGRLHF